MIVKKIVWPVSISENHRTHFILHLVMSSKPYQPDRFTQNLTPIETLQEENQQLKHLVNPIFNH